MFGLLEVQLSWDDIEVLSELYSSSMGVCRLGELTPLGRKTIELMLRMAEGLEPDAKHPGYKAVIWHRKTLETLRAH